MSDERAVIATESAFIRTAIKDDIVEIEYYNVHKFLDIHISGYPAHFGQLECLKLGKR
ncbi:clathrin associated protein complex large subunit, partial [Physocladia obscura]